MIIDARLHRTGRKVTDDALRTLDEAGIDIETVASTAAVPAA